MTIENILAPLSAETFYASYRDRKLFHIARNQPGFYDSVLDKLEIDDFFSRERAIYPSMVMVKDGRELPLIEWTKTKRNRAIEVIDFRKSMQAYKNGASIVLNSFHKDALSLGRLCAHIESEWGTVCNANVYITPPSNQGHSKHSDIQDILVLQLTGSKRWTIYEDKTSDESEEIVLQPGDLMYLPGGIPHAPRATDSHSTHISISLLVPQLHDVLKEMAKMASKTSELRKPLPLRIASKEEKADFFKKAAQKLTAFTSEMDVQQLCTQVEEKFRGMRADNHRGVWTNLLENYHLSVEDELRLNEWITLSISKDDKFLYLKANEHQFRYPLFLEELIEFVVSNHCFCIQQLPGKVPEESKVAMVKKWLDAGIFSISN